VYYSHTFFPVYAFDPTNGSLTTCHKGPMLILALGVAALLWGALAMVFITPIWAGVMVTNIAKLGIVLYVSDAVRRTQAELQQAVSLLLQTDPSVLLDDGAEATSSSSTATGLANGHEPATANGAASAGSDSLASLTVLDDGTPAPRARLLDALLDAVEIAIRLTSEAGQRRATSASATMAVAGEAGPTNDGPSSTVAVSVSTASATVAAVVGQDAPQDEDLTPDGLPGYAFMFHGIFTSLSLARRAACLAAKAENYAWRSWSTRQLFIPCIPLHRGEWAAVCNRTWHPCMDATALDPPHVAAPKAPEPVLSRAWNWLTSFHPQYQSFARLGVPMNELSSVLVDPTQRASFEQGDERSQLASTPLGRVLPPAGATAVPIPVATPTVLLEPPSLARLVSKLVCLYSLIT
jgi:hypothetical protein